MKVSQNYINSNYVFKENENSSIQNFKVVNVNLNEIDYGKNNLKFCFSNFFQLFKCYSCSELEFNPDVCSNCENLFCSKCINSNNLNNPSKCPKGCENSNFNKLSLLLLSLINCLEVSCVDCLNYSIKKQDKSIISTYGLYDYANHIKICKYRICYCFGCNEAVTLNEIEFHIECCDKIKKECPHCELKFEISQFDFHLLNCNSNIVCDECGLEVPRKNLKFHSNLECKNEIKAKLEKTENKLKLVQQEIEHFKSKISSGYSQIDMEPGNIEISKIVHQSNYCDYSNIIYNEKSNKKCLIYESKYENEIDNIFPLDNSIIINSVYENLNNKNPANNKQMSIYRDIEIIDNEFGSYIKKELKENNSNCKFEKINEHVVDINKASDLINEDANNDEIQIKNVEVLNKEFDHPYIEFLNLFEPLKTIDFYDYSTNNLKDLVDKKTNEGVSFYSNGQCILYLKKDYIIEMINYRYMIKIEEDIDILSSIDCKEMTYFSSSKIFATINLIDDNGETIETVKIIKENLSGKIVEVKIKNLKPVKTIAIFMNEKYILYNAFGIDYFSIKVSENSSFKK